jgi:hypothetical protein
MPETVVEYQKIDGIPISVPNPQEPPLMQIAGWVERSNTQRITKGER